MGRIQGLTDTRVLTSSKLLKSAKGYVFSMTVAWHDATVGDLVHLRDGVDGNAPILVSVAVPTVAGTMQLNWANGKEFTEGLYYHEAVPEKALVEITYK